ncbi:hypothetical protein EKO27_g10606, partial [Xylaria grammica]
EAAAGVMAALGTMCESLGKTQNEGWVVAPEGGQDEEEGVRELWLTWPGDNDAIRTLAAFKLADVKFAELRAKYKNYW